MTVKVVSRTVIVDQVVGPRLAAAGYALLLQYAENRANARLLGVGTIDERAALVAVLPEEVFASGRGVRVFDLVGGWGDHRTPDLVDRYVAGGNREEIDTRAAHDELMIVITHGVAVGECSQIAGVATMHVDKAHQLPALTRVRGGNPSRVGPHACRSRDPYVQVGVGVVSACLLPHLEESMHRVPGGGGQRGGRSFERWGRVFLGVGHVARNLKRAVRQAARKTGIDAVGDVVELLILDADQARRRQGCICCCPRRV